MSFWIGTSGCCYDHWVGIVYPPGTAVAKRLEWYIKLFDTVEANNTFYHWPRDITFTHWYERLPDKYVFTVKASRILSHILKLTRPEKSIDRMRPGLEALKEKRGVLLIQLPDTFAINLDRLAEFLPTLPQNWRASIEFRHPSWHIDATYALLRQHNVAYCVMSGAALPCQLEATADFVYVRMHGPDSQHLYAGSYSDDDLRWSRDRLLEWGQAGLDVYVYFNNDGSGNAVRNALRLKEFVAQAGFPV